ncbi:MAG: dihydroxy-acid dehydratase [Anaerolineae bacterium]
MPEWGQIPIPNKLLRRESKTSCASATPASGGTSYGTVVMHAAPEAAVGGPLAV